ncbi:MAG: hypothetical protein AAB434_07045 [Planctomycetota bacterium]
MFATPLRWMSYLGVMLVLASEALAQGGPEDAFHWFRNGSAWGMPQTALVCLGTLDERIPGARVVRGDAPTEVLTVAAPPGSQVRLVRINARSRLVFWPDQRTVEKLSVVPGGAWTVQFAFTNSTALNLARDPWDQGETFEIRVRFPNGQTAQPVRIARACGFQIRHAAGGASMRGLAVAAYAAKGGQRTPVDVQGSTRVGFRLDTRPNLGLHPVGARIWISESVEFSATATWSVADNILIGASGIVRSDIPQARTGRVHGAPGGGMVVRALGLPNVAGGMSMTFGLPPTWRIQEAGDRTFSTNRAGGYLYVATATVRANITSNNAVGDVLVSTSGKATGLTATFVPRVPF